MAMDETAYQRWWPLHLRVAKGEVLNAEERVVYNRGVDELDREERLTLDPEILRQALAIKIALSAEQAQLREQRKKLDAKIPRSEAEP